MNTKRSKTFFTIILLVCLFSLNDCFYISLKAPSAEKLTRKCFTSHVYKQERLLIDLQVPMLQKDLDVGIQVMLINKKDEVKKEHKVVLTEIIKQAKYKKTVLKQTHDVSQMSDDLSLEYETCIFLKNRVPISTQPKVDFEGSFLPAMAQNDLQKKVDHSSQIYLFYLNLLTRFSHVLQQKRLPSTPVPTPHKYTKQNLQLLQKHSTRLLELAKQQITIHRENEKMESRTQKHVNDLQNSIYSMSLTQTAILVCGSLVHINLVRKYLTENKLI